MSLFNKYPVRELILLTIVSETNNQVKIILIIFFKVININLIVNFRKIYLLLSVPD